MLLHLQAATLVEKVKKSLGGRSLRPSDVTRLGTLSRGLLPRDLDDMVDRPDDVDDLADVLGDHEDELSSGIVSYPFPRLSLKHFLCYSLSIP